MMIIIIIIIPVSVMNARGTTLKLDVPVIEIER